MSIEGLTIAYVCYEQNSISIFAFLHSIPSTLTHTHKNEVTLQNLPSSILSEVLWIRKMLAQLMTQKIMTTTR